MKILPALVMLCLFGGTNLASADGDSPTQDGFARVRFFGQAVIGLSFYENKTCYSGDGVSVSRKGFAGAFGSKKNISLGMPETPNVINLKERDGFLAKAFYREYSVNAGKPLTVIASLTENTGRTGRSCGDIAGSFVPEQGKDYEVTFNDHGNTCELNVTQIDTTAAEMKLVPVQLASTNKCSEKDSKD